jgi:hypothetical protein
VCLVPLWNVGDSPVGSAGVVGASSDDAEESVLAPVSAPRTDKHIGKHINHTRIHTLNG